MKNGNPSPQGSDHVNWNGELIWKMRSELAIEWDIFEQEIPIIFKDLLRRLKKCLEEMGTYLGSQLNSVLLNKNLSGMLEPHEVSYIVREMLPTYRAASEISGELPQSIINLSILFEAD
ncbi:hypothetical protein EIK77_004405 [Talaromyces pinophilus]|nr:hypothetical protein EIK77_004405 [Talaromyces pinophilus]